MERHHLFICTGSTCTQQGAEESLYCLRRQLLERHIQNVRLTLVRCLGQCGNGPNMVLYGKDNPPEGTWYGHLSERGMNLLVTQHLLQGKVLSDFIITPVEG